MKLDRLYNPSVQLILEAVLFVADETVSELNSCTDGVVANAPDATAEVGKAGVAVRLRDRLGACCLTVGSGCAPAAWTRRLVIVTAECSVLLQIRKQGSQIIKEWISAWDLLSVTRRRHEVSIHASSIGHEQH